MSQIDWLADQIKTKFPEAEVQTRKADDPSGYQFLNVRFNSLEVAVEWKCNSSFGLSSYRDDEVSLTDGLFDVPDEWYATPEAIFHRIVSLLLEPKSTRPSVATISQIRHERSMSQESLSALLKVKQATYSKLERRGDMKVSSLKKVAEALGGKLLVQFVFSDTRDVRELTFR